MCDMEGNRSNGESERTSASNFVCWKNGIYAMYIITTLNFASMSIFSPLINHQIRRFEATALEIGFVSSAYRVCTLVSSPAVGRWSQKYGSRLLFCVSLATTAGINFVQGWTSIYFVFAIARGTAGIFKHTTTLGKLVMLDFIHRDEIPLTFGRLNAFAHFGIIIGPAIGGRLMQQENGTSLICISSAFIYIIQSVFLVSCICTAPGQSHPLPNKNDTVENITETVATTPRAPSPSDTSDHSTWRICLERKVKALLFSQFLFQFATGGLRSTFPILMNTKYSAKVSTIGYLNSMQSVFGSCTGFMLGKFFHYYGNDKVKVTRHGGTLLSVSLVGIFLSKNLMPAAVAIFALEVANAILLVGMMAILLDNTTTNISPAYILGYSQMVSAISLTLTPVISGIISHFFNSHDAPIILGAITSAIGVIILSLL